jgi:hypothetical protein
MDLMLLAIPAGIYLGMPLLIKFGQNVDPNPPIETVDPSQWPANVKQAMSRAEHDLYALGFTITGRFQIGGAIPNTRTMLTMLVNYTSGDKAMITAIWGCANGVWNLGTLYTEFSTRFEDGHSFDTMNSAMVNSFKAGPKDIKTQAPNVKEAAELWSLHRYVMRQHGAQGRKLVYDAKDTLPYLRRIWRESFEEQMSFGRYVFNGRQFQPSFSGAYLMTWGQMWPMIWIRRAQMNSRAAALVREWKNSTATPAATSPFDQSGIVIVPEG